MSEKKYAYQLIEFIGEFTVDGKKSIDFVPTKWMEFDMNTGQCFAKFMPPPYSFENLKILKDLKNTGGHPPHDWPRYAVLVRGGAESYKKAVERLNRLTTEEFAYTTGCDDPYLKARATTKSLEHGTKKKQTSIQDLLSVPTLKDATFNSVNSQLSCNETSDEKSSSSTTAHESGSQRILSSSSLDGRKFVGKRKKNKHTPKKQPTTKQQPSSRHAIRRAATGIGENHFPSYDVKILLTELNNIKYEQRQATIVLENIKSALEKILTKNGTESSITESFELKYDVQLPFSSFEQFMAFEKQLSEIKECRAAFVKSLCRQYDANKTISKNIAFILRRCFTRELAMQFNAQKRKEGKKIFKETAFSACLLGVIEEQVTNERIPSVSESQYLTHLGAVLSNAKDWGVPRRRCDTRVDSENP